MAFNKFPPSLVIQPSKEYMSSSLNSYEPMMMRDDRVISQPKIKKILMSHQQLGSEVSDCCIIGSSHGWLILLTNITTTHPRICLLNPFTQSRIQLPKFRTDLSFPLIDQTRKDHGYKVTTNKDSSRNGVSFIDQIQELIPNGVSFIDQIQELIPKVILSSNPSTDRDFVLVCMYKIHSSKYRLLFYQHRDQEWSSLEDEYTCNDIVFVGNKFLYALKEGPLIDVWNLHGKNKKKKIIMRIEFPCPERLLRADKITFPRNLFSSQWYLVASSSSSDNINQNNRKKLLDDDEVFLVVRYIGEFVRCDGEVVTEADTLPEDDTQPLVCPYRTVCFHVYKLDFGLKSWVKVENLKDGCAIFVGGNQSVAVSTQYSELKGNAIYFTDDYWGRMHEDNCYGGHNMGIFNLEDGSIEPIFDNCDQQIERMVPPPVWVLPH